MDLVFPVLQGIALGGLLVGLIWIVWECATHPADDARQALEPQRRFVPPDPRDTLIVVVPPVDTDRTHADDVPAVPRLIAGRPRAADGVVTELH